MTGLLCWILVIGVLGFAFYKSQSLSDIIYSWLEPKSKD